MWTVSSSMQNGEIENLRCMTAVWTTSPGPVRCATRSSACPGINLTVRKRRQLIKDSNQRTSRLVSAGRKLSKKAPPCSCTDVAYTRRRERGTSPSSARIQELGRPPFVSRLFRADSLHWPTFSGLRFIAKSVKGPGISGLRRAIRIEARCVGER